MRYQILIDIGKPMKRISNAAVSELIRLIPILIEHIPPGQSLRVQNAIRLSKRLITKLKKLKDEQRKAIKKATFYVRE